MLHDHRSRSTTDTMENQLLIIEDLENTIRSRPVNENLCSYVLSTSRGLLDATNPNEVRHRVWRLYIHLVQGRAECIGQQRYLLFDLIRKNDRRSEDIPFRIDLLNALTDYGRSISYYENDIADCMVLFLSNLIERRTNISLKVKKLPWEVQKELLQLITGLVKFNSSHISSNNSQALCLMIQYTCQLAFDSDLPAELEKIYEFFNVVLSYGHLPNQFDNLSLVVVVVCNGMNKKNLFGICQKIMRNLLGTHLGFACLRTLMHIIEDQTNYTEPALIRGAVYFLVHSLWGDFHTKKATLSPNTVLPAFKNLLENEQIASPCIFLEICNGIHMFLMSVINPTKNANKLLQRRPSLMPEDLPEITEIVTEWTWNLVLDVCHNLVYSMIVKEDELKDNKELVSMIQLLIEALKDLLSQVLSVNDFAENEQMSNDYVSLLLLMNEDFISRLFDIIQRGINYLSSESILKLISYRFKYITENLTVIPNRDWFSELDHLMTDFFSQSNLSTDIRKQFLLQMQQFLSTNSSYISSDAFFSKVAKNHFSSSPNQNRSSEIGISFLLYFVKELNVPENLAQIIALFIKATLTLIAKLFLRKHSVDIHGGAIRVGTNVHQQVTHQISAPYPSNQADLCNDLVYFVESLASIFQEKFDHQQCHEIAVDTFAKSPPQSTFSFSSPPSLYNRSFSYDVKIKYSPFVLLSGNYTSDVKSRLDKPPGILLQETFYSALHTIILENIKSETDWTVLETVFDNLAQLLKNKGLVMAVSERCVASNENRFGEHFFHDSLIPLLEKFASIDSLNTRLGEIDFGDCKLAKADVLLHVFKSISELVSYPLLPSNQTLLINKCLKNGLVQFSSKPTWLRQCIISLTICSIEMQTTMNKFLKDIIITLSQISSSKTLAVPKLEFLSNIILFPDLYYTFTVKQYLSIFSIATQYVSPNKYGEYIVTLALRQVQMWFLCSPAAFRVSLMKFLSKQLKTTILESSSSIDSTTPQLSQRLNSISLGSDHRNSNSNLDSHHSSSLHFSSSSAFNVPLTSQITTEGLILDPNNREQSKVELVEVCMDMFSANAFNTTSPLPLKPSMIDKILNRQKAQMWLIGHKIVQITPTVCSARAVKNGLCNKCYYICHMNAAEPEMESMVSSSASSQSNIFSERSTLSNQLSCEQMSRPIISDASSLASSRRRHRSEIHSSRVMNSAQPLFTHDDTYFSKRRSTAESALFSPITTPTTKAFENINASDPDLLTNNSDVDCRYCRCWCQNWAEILIRRSTGNTRWISRVENHLGDFPYWTRNSKEADDSLAEIFSHTDPEINMALKMQIEADEEPDDKIEHQSTTDITQQQLISTPVTRASSFGSRRPADISEQQQTSKQKPEVQPKHQVLERVERRLQKDFSVDQDDPPTVSLLSTQPSQLTAPSPVNSNASSDMTVTSPDRNSANYRDRSSTISVMTPVQKSASSTGVFQAPPPKSSSSLNMSSSRPSISSGALSPQAVFLQLYYNSTFKDVNELSLSEKPILLEKNDALVRSISCLDRITPYETHKIACLYIGPGQAKSKIDILSNQIGSLRYTNFLLKIGHTVNLKDVDPSVCFLGGLDQNEDGPYAISWGDHLVQAIFHVGTLMPHKDRHCTNKMRHIGNDFVAIIYNNSGEKFDICTIKGDGQFLQAMVVITPLERESNSVQMIGAKKEFIEFIGHSEAQIISDHALPVYVRQLALHANLAAMVSHTSKSFKSYNISNWISRLQNIKRIRSRVCEGLPLYNSEMVHYLRGSAAPPQTPHPLSASSPHGRFRLGTGVASQSSRDESDSVISSSVASPNIAPGSAGTNSGAFEYETGTRLVFPDFTEFTKEPN
ncbi:Tuberous sclerosis 2-like protein [Tyrophagus putrescentiae]|nr:Tuberous sclerosis 2-like protein [Tyrophagus putrescentiae]